MGLSFNLNNDKPIITVKIGVVAFNIPASELEIPLFTSLAVNKNAGIAFPKNPIPKMGSNLFFGIFEK